MFLSAFVGKLFINTARIRKYGQIWLGECPTNLIKSADGESIEVIEPNLSGEGQ